MDTFINKFSRKSKNKYVHIKLEKAALNELLTDGRLTYSNKLGNLKLSQDQKTPDIFSNHAHIQ